MISDDLRDKLLKLANDLEAHATELTNVLKKMELFLMKEGYREKPITGADCGNDIRKHDATCN